MRSAAKEGWYEDPAGRHEYRWFSEGRPTELVKDGGLTGRDRISMSDPELFARMQLADSPDVAPLQYGYGANALSWVTGPGLLVQFAVGVCVLGSFFLILYAAAPFGVGLGLAALGVAIAAVNRVMRGRRLRRYEAAARGELTGKTSR